MCNYVCQLSLGDQRIDITAGYKAFIKTPETLKCLAGKHALTLITFKMPKNRNVAYLKICPVDTAHAETTFQLSSRGSIVIQGTKGLFSITKLCIERFATFAEAAFAPYLATL